MSTSKALLAVVATLLVGAAVAWAGSQGSVTSGGVAVFALCGALSFALNWLVFVHAYANQTEQYFDLTGSLTYLTLVAVGVALAGGSPRSLLLALLVTVWALRLGSFLFARIRQDGSDGRFDNLKTHFARFLMTWTLQGLWVFLTLSCALAAITSAQPKPLGVVAAIGAALWLAGFAIEVAADQQKRAFRASPDNSAHFIHTGLWAWSRHPNYFGEITLWAGIALISVPVLSGWQLVTLISPVFVYVLLTRISGIPLLESRAKKKWGGDPDFEAYKARTPALWPRPPAAG